jgi:hypothetical protein
MRLDRDTLLQWYTTSADQFETIVNGFLVRVKGTPVRLWCHAKLDFDV